jgi:hypothetical protein
VLSAARVTLQASINTQVAAMVLFIVTPCWWR